MGQIYPSSFRSLTVPERVSDTPPWPPWDPLLSLNLKMAPTTVILLLPCGSVVSCWSNQQVFRDQQGSLCVGRVNEGEGEGR